MADGTATTGARSFPGLSPQLRGRVALIFMVMTLAACLVAAALSLSRAASEREAMTAKALEAAKALSFGFDQEVAAVNYLLKGLSKSPALLSGDTKAFYDQLKATPVPDGSWLILNDLERQVANTLRPFGSPLLRHADVPNYQEQLDRIRDRRWTVSGRFMAPLKGSIVVALSLRLDGPDGRMKGHITTILAEARLGAIMNDQTLPAGWTKALHDRMLQPIMADRYGHQGSDIPAPRAWLTGLPMSDPTARSRERSKPWTTRGGPSSSPFAVRVRRTGRPRSRCRLRPSMRP